MDTEYHIPKVSTDSLYIPSTTGFGPGQHKQCVSVDDEVFAVFDDENECLLYAERLKSIYRVEAAQMEAARRLIKSLERESC